MISKLKQYFDRKIVVILLLTYVFFRTINTVLIAIFKLTDESGRYDIPWSDLVLNSYIVHLIFVLPFVPFIAALTKYLMLKKQKTWVIFSIHFAISIVFKPVAGLFPSIFAYLLREGTLNQAFFEGYFGMFFRYAEYNIYIYITLVAITYTYYSFEKAKSFQIQQSQLNAELATNKLKALKSNLQPHFLFNTLNSVHVLIDENKEKSKDVLVDLSNILREILDKNTEDKIELQDELSILKKYVNILKTRYEDQINITTEIEEGLDHALIPTLTIQQLVENAVKHGIDKSHLFLNVQIEIFRQKENLEVKVINDGKLLKQNFTTLLKNGSGLNGINERFKVLYGKGFCFDIYNDKNQVINHFKIPLEYAVSELI